MRYILVFATILFFIGCDQKFKIKVTSDYVITLRNNSSNFFRLKRFKVKKDSTLDVFQPDFDLHYPNHWNIVNKLSVDSSFQFDFIYDDVNKVGIDTIYFNKTNKGKWYDHFLKNSRLSLPKLDKKTWYQFSYLTDQSQQYLYVYIDSLYKTHLFIQGLSNW